MSAYTYSTSPNFGTNDNLTLVSNDCAAQITTALLDLIAVGDSLAFSFENPLNSADQLILSNIVKTRDSYEPPQIVPAYLETGSTILKHTINGIETKYIGQQSNEIHISGEQQGNYSSLKAAITAHPGPNQVFIIHPGTYVEDNPLTLATGTVIYSNGNAENTFIVAANPNADILHVGMKNKIEGITIMGAYGAGCRGIYFNAAASGGYGYFTAVFECFIKNCNIAIEMDGNNIQSYGGVPDVLYGREIVITPTPALFDVGVTSLAKGIYAHSGGQFISMGMSIFGIPPTAAPSPALPVIDAYSCKDSGSKLAMTLSNCYFCYNGLNIDNDCQTELTLLTLKYNVNGVVIGPNGTQTRLSVNSLEVGHCTGYDLIIQPTAAIIEVHSGVMDDSKFMNANGVRLNMRYHTNRNGQSRQKMLGIINVGNSVEPAKMIIGEGSYDNTNIVMVNTDLEAGTWTNLTELANEESNTTPFNLFAGTAVDNCLYLGRLKNVMGIKINITTATTATPQNSLEWTYWNGSSWVPFSVMQTRDVAPYWYINDCFISEVNTYHIRFGIKSDTNMVAKEINGITMKWVRVRVITVLPSIPQSEYVKFHTNAMKINGDGFMEYFGDSRTVKKLSWEVSGFGNVTAMTDQSIYMSKKLAISLTKNNFAASQLSRICMATFIPTDIDNSFPIKLKLSFVGSSNTAGNVKFTVRYDFSYGDTDLFLVEADAPNNTTNEKTASVVVAVSAEKKEYRTEIALDLSGIDANLYNGGPQLSWISIERDAGSGDDTYVGSISLVQIVPYYISWIDGGHLLGY